MRTNAMFARADAARLPLDDDSVDLVFTSPPYLDARDYLENGRKIGASRKAEAWARWMLDVVAEGCRVSRGLVLVNCAGVERDWCYQPGPEMLISDWWRSGGRCWRPNYWHRKGTPGIAHHQGLRPDVEYVFAFTSCRKAIPWADNVAMGHPPKNAVGPNYRPGVRMHNGMPSPSVYKNPKLVNPGNLVAIPTGGGKMGDPIASENEAAFPERLAEFFIRTYCPPGGLVLDPFSGSGTTVAVARNLGRVGIGFDLRASQCQLGRRRLAPLGAIA